MKHKKVALKNEEIPFGEKVNYTVFTYTQCFTFAS